MGSIPFQGADTLEGGAPPPGAAKTDRACQGQHPPPCSALGRARVSSQQTLAHDIGAGMSHSVLNSVRGPPDWTEEFVLDYSQGPSAKQRALMFTSILSGFPIRALSFAGGTFFGMTDGDKLTCIE